jgi:hypothetical protein
LAVDFVTNDQVCDCAGETNRLANGSIDFLFSSIPVAFVNPDSKTDPDFMIRRSADDVFSGVLHRIGAYVIKIFRDNYDIVVDIGRRIAAPWLIFLMIRTVTYPIGITILASLSLVIWYLHRGSGNGATQFNKRKNFAPRE